MPTFISIMSYTEHGIKTVNESVRRADGIKAAGKKFGITMKDIYWTMGQYDVIVTWEAPDGPTMSAFMLSIAAAGNVRGQTLRAYDAGEMSAILSKLP